MDNACRRALGGLCVILGCMAAVPAAAAGAGAVPSAPRLEVQTGAPDSRSLRADPLGRFVIGIDAAGLSMVDLKLGTTLRSSVIAGGGDDLQLSPDGTLAAFSAGEMTILWDVKKWRQLFAWPKNSPAAFSPDNRWLLVGQWSQAPVLLNVATDEWLPLEFEALGDVGGAHFSADSRSLILLRRDVCVLSPCKKSPTELEIYGVQSRKRVQVIACALGFVGALAADPSGQHLIVWSPEGHAEIHRADTGALEQSIDLLSGYHGDPPDARRGGDIDSVAVSRDAQSIVFSDSSRLGLWQRAGGRALLQSRVPLWFLQSRARSLLINPVTDELLLLLAGEETLAGRDNRNSDLLTVSLPDLSIRRRLEGRNPQIGSARFSADGQTLVATFGDTFQQVAPVLMRIGEPDAVEQRDQNGLQIWDLSFSTRVRAVPTVTRYVAAAITSNEGDSVIFPEIGVGLTRVDGLNAIAPSGVTAAATANASADGSTLVAIDPETAQTTAVDLNAQILASFTMPGYQRFIQDLFSDTKLLAVDSGARHILYAGAGGHVDLFDHEGRPIWQARCEDLTIKALALANDGSRLAYVCGDTFVIDPRGGTALRLPVEAGALAFSPDGRQLAVYADALRLYELTTGTVIHQFSGDAARATGIAFRPDGRWIVTGGEDGRLSLWSVADATLRATLVPFRGGDWLVTTPEGLFDGSSEGIRRSVWRFDNGQDSATLPEVLPVESFLNEYFEPGLLNEVLEGAELRKAKDFERIDRRQPTVALAELPENPAQKDPRHMRIRITVREAPAGVDPTSGRHYMVGSGAQELRLFRNGTLVWIRHGRLPLIHGEAILEADIPRTSGLNQLQAYVFNGSSVKSLDANLNVAGAATPVRQGVAYVIAVGVNHYQDRARLPTLIYAVSDATDFASSVAAALRAGGRYAAVRTAVLSDALAGRSLLMAALARVAGREHAPLRPEAEHELAQLQAAQPEDTVLFFYAGHGDARASHFYLLPQDADYAGLEAGRTGESSHVISDEDLMAAFEPIQAGHIMLVLDACHSGQAIESTRVGPVNSIGLAQLSFEKGMYVLAASQAQQSALETSRLSHGLLTYALIEQGLNQHQARQSGVVEVRHWMTFTEAAMRSIQSGAGTAGARGVTRVLEPTVAMADRLQRPRLFMRREPDVDPFLIESPPAAPSAVESSPGAAPAP